jgi:formate hydrogenlyase subunit 3/multisubunit Na+/H+ antiporter MnhD subunit
MTGTLVQPLLLVGGALAATLLSAVTSLATARQPQLLRTLVLPLFALAGILAAAAGALTLGSGTVAIAELPLGLPWLHWRIRLDALSGFMLCLIGVITFACGWYATGYVRGMEQGRDPLPMLGGCSGFFLAGMLLVVLADDAYLFMIAWELMSLASYFLVVFQHDHAANRRAAFLYLLLAHIAGLAILLGYGVMAAFAGEFTFAAMREADMPFGWRCIAFALAFVGFGTKAGLVPLHAWLPEAHPVAPSHISALLSGVMLKVAVYGFIRVTFDLLGAPHWQWGVVVLIAGSCSALFGVLYALMQHDLKRLLAYSSVENIGIVFIGLGLAQMFLATGQTAVGTVAFVAALYHACNHALFKSLLFLGAGAVQRSTHERDLEKMGGLLRRMPWAGFCFLIGCLSIAGLPPFNGFVSEWLTLQAALQSWQFEDGVLRSIVAISAAMLALTGALAAACFVRAYGIAFLGQARSRPVRRARGGPLAMRLAQAFLAALCVLFGVLPTFFISVLNSVPRQLLGHGLVEADAHGWLWLTPIAPQTASYGAPLVAIALLLAVGLGLWLFGRGAARVKRCDPWDCGFAPPTPAMQYTAAAFAQPFRRVFGALLQVDESLAPQADGRPRHHLTITDRAFSLCYTPVARLVEQAARLVVRLQSGNVRIYLGWSLGTLLVLLWIVA